jgi:cytochrome c peroxidase
LRLSWVLALAFLSGLATTASGEPVPAFDWGIPAWLPPPLVPADNPMSRSKVELGRHLFYDKRLSADGTMACASCHEQARAFTDGRPTPVGVTGEPHPRNAMSLANVGYFAVLTWSNPLLTRLEQQSLVPLFGEAPVEMGLAGSERKLFETLAADPAYPARFRDAFPEQSGAINLATITKAIAAFERTLISARSPYDRFRYEGRGEAISPAAKRGESLFFSERLECFHCHGGVHLSDNLVHSRKPFAEFGFHNTGLYNVDGRGAYPAGNVGLVEHSGRPGDMGRFRTPSLRNVALTAPYMHDGSIATLEEVLSHYAAGGRARSGLTSEFLPGFKLSDDERADLVAFLVALTDREFIADPRFSNPWTSGPNANPLR